MDLQEIKDHVSQLKDVIGSKKNQTLAIFYNEINLSEILNNDECVRVTPSYTTETNPTLSFRGSIQKHGPDKLIVELEYVPLSEEHIMFCVSWNFLVYNEETDAYLNLASSETDITANNLTSRISIPFLATKNFINKNTALFKWNITFRPLTICQDKFKSSKGNCELYDEDNFEKALDKILKTFSSDDKSGTKKKETLLSIKDALNDCENGQKMNVERLQMIEQNFVEINSRISGILNKKIDLPQTSFVKEVTKLTSSSPNTDKTYQTELETNDTRKSNEGIRFTPSPTTSESTKQKQLHLKRKTTLKEDRSKKKRAERFPTVERQKNKKLNVESEQTVIKNLNFSEPSKIQSKRKGVVYQSDSTDMNTFEPLQKKRYFTSREQDIFSETNKSLSSVKLYQNPSREQDIFSETNKSLSSLKLYQNLSFPKKQTNLSDQSDFGLQSDLESAVSIFTTINSNYNISEEMKEKTDQILSMIQQCFSILEMERKTKAEQQPIGIEKKEANQVPKYMGLFSLKPLNSLNKDNI